MAIKTITPPKTTKTTPPPPTTTTVVQGKGKWDNLSKHACRFFFLLVILQVPLFRVQCRSGMCTTPIHLTATQLISSEVFPLPVVKGLLYPGALVNGLINDFSVPRWDNLLGIYNLTNVKDTSAAIDVQRLEVLAGSYFCVAGSFVGLLKRGRMSMFGTLLVIWGLLKEGYLGKPENTDPTKAVYVYPTMLLALAAAFLSVNYNVKKAMNAAPVQPVARPLKGSSKSKLR